MGCSDQFNFPLNIYVSVRLWLVLLPLCCEAGIYAFKCSLHLNTKEAVQRDNEWREMETFPVASLQIFTLYLLLGHQEELLWRLVLVRDGDSVHDTHVVNNAHPYLKKFADQQIYLIIGRLFSIKWVVEKGTLSMGHYLPHGATWMDEMSVAHVWVCILLLYGVNNPITDLVMTSCDEYIFIAVQCVMYREWCILSMAVGRNVWGIYAITEEKVITPFLIPQICYNHCGCHHS